MSRRRSPQGGKVADRAFRHARAVTAGLAAAAASQRRAVARAESLPTKGAAWSAGYRVGYRRAAAWWRAKMRRDQVAADRRLGSAWRTRRSL